MVDFPDLSKDNEAYGEEMLEEAPNELQDIEGHSSLAVATGFLVWKKTVWFSTLRMRLLATTTLKDVRGELLERGPTASHSLGVDVQLICKTSRGI